MEGSYRKEIQAASPNQALLESCAKELTRLNSGASSLSVADSKDALQENGNVTRDKYTGWTNEKHNAFLGHLEASFVKQLHRSMTLRAGSVEMNQSCKNLSEELSAHVNKASEQLPFLRHGCQKKIKTVRKPPVVYIAADYHDCHVIPSKPGELQKTVCRLTEGSGQNFMDEDYEEKSRCKKMKTALVDTTDQEQIVPTRNMGVQELLVPCCGEATK
ncbi:hypothetical protein HAX54_029983 [Datura stramonium]|uniref:Uncharacterized protein n=1 Tax=Datura stramonium TaxID=4076 RepID=A0ABS8SAL1_DATST|nr:hypothetical protein [Datura stramonium]